MHREHCVASGIRNILISRMLPMTPKVYDLMRAGYCVARILGQHVGEEQLRRRTRIIQDLRPAAGYCRGDGDSNWFTICPTEGDHWVIEADRVG
ncbi:hypothetical protein V1291_005776 [Nitrobacteraceae bacterium AZCC 1564]